MANNEITSHLELSERYSRQFEKSGSSIVIEKLDQMTGGGIISRGRVNFTPLWHGYFRLMSPLDFPNAALG
jgi:hypothetical protein